jgi:hypothetical protein
MIYWKLAEMRVPEAKPNLTSESAWPGEYLIYSFLASMITKPFDKSIPEYFKHTIKIKFCNGQEKQM